MSIRVTATDCQTLGICMSGVRRGCAANGIDFRRLVREGIPVEEIEHVSDPTVQRVIEQAKSRGNRDG